MQLTQEQILKLAPDDASAKAGQQLANVAKWVLKCSHEKAIWGDCQGSGTKPYRTIIDLNNIAFKCSCPSRKFPCKHGLGLLLLFANNQGVFAKEENLAPHVEEWIGKREDKTETKKEQKPIDEKAQQKRIDARKKKVDAGVEELRLWLKDTVRTGIAQIPQNMYQFNQNIIARMVDAQAGGFANLLRKLNKINFYKEGWQKDLIKQLSKIYLLTEAYQKNEDFTEALKLEIESLIGWNISKDEVLNNQTPIQDDWLVLSITTEEEGNLSVERIWLYGRNTRKMGLLLNFYVGNQLPQNLFIAGATLKAALVFFPSIYPQRVLIKEQFNTIDTFEALLPNNDDSLTNFYKKISETLAQNPFIDKIPLIVQAVYLVYEGESWFLVDVEKEAIALQNSQDEFWKILAITKAKPFDCFGIYENENFEIHALRLDNQFYFIK